jgi:hypothetical protein
MAREDFDLADRNPLDLFYAQMIEKINLKLPEKLTYMPFKRDAAQAPPNYR